MISNRSINFACAKATKSERLLVEYCELVVTGLGDL